MRDYSKLTPFFWTRGAGKRLRGNPAAQIVAAYLSTSPAANMIGIYYVSIATIANDTGLDVETVQAALVDVSRAKYAHYDREAELAWIPNHAKFEIGTELKRGDKRRPKVLAEIAQVEDHPFATDFLDLYGDAYAIEKPHRRGMQSSIPPVDGASAKALGDQADQDRTDQIRTGQEQRGIRLGPDGDSNHAFSAYTSGVKDTTGKPVTALQAGDRKALVAMVNAHAPEVAGQELLDWIRVTARDFAKQHDATYGGYSPVQCAKWLDGGRKQRAGPQGAPRQGLGSAANAPWMNGGNTFNFETEDPK